MDVQVLQCEGYLGLSPRGKKVAANSGLKRDNRLVEGRLDIPRKEAKYLSL